MSVGISLAKASHMVTFEFVRAVIYVLSGKDIAGWGTRFLVNKLLQ